MGLGDRSGVWSWDAPSGERTTPQFCLKSLDEAEDGYPFNQQTFLECPLWACPVLGDAAMTQAAPSPAPQTVIAQSEQSRGEEGSLGDCRSPEKGPVSAQGVVREGFMKET